jgi:general secretion pathway protein I
MMRSGGMQRARGFTLVEVIVATVVAALCLSALSSVFSGNMRSAVVASELSRASTLAQSLLASAGVEKPLTDGVEAGNAEGDLNWTRTVSEEAADDAEIATRPPLLLKRVTVRVQVGADTTFAAARAVELSTLRAIPRPPTL